MKKEKIFVDKKVIEFIIWQQKLGSRLEWYSTEDLVDKYNNYLKRKKK